MDLSRFTRNNVQQSNKLNMFTSATELLANIYLTREFPDQEQWDHWVLCMHLGD